MSPTILLLSPDSAEAEKESALLEACEYRVEHVVDYDNWSVKEGSSAPDAIIACGYQNAEQGIQACQTILAACSSSDVFSLLIVKQISPSEKDAFFSAGGDEIIIEPRGGDEISTKIARYFAHQKQKKELNKQVTEASQMALLAMENSSDLGVVINFVKNALRSKSHSDLAGYLFEATLNYSDSGLIESKNHDGYEYFCSAEEMDFDLKKMMMQFKSDERIVKSNDIVQVNQDNLILLLEGLPSDNPEKMGRISDSLAILCDIADRFAKVLAVETGLKASEQSRKRFLTTLSHELRTPLNAVMGFSKAVLGKDPEKPVGEQGTNALQRIFDGASQLNNIIDTLVDISTVSSGAARLSNSEINVDTLILRMRTQFGPPAKDKNLELTISAQEGLSFNSDEKRVNKMLANLICNAVKFTETGSIAVNVSSQEDRVLGACIRFDVQDTGIGIDEIAQEKIFSDVGQLDDEHDRSQYGAGLGLYYVGLISRQLGGEVSVVSELGKGSEFKLSLPIKRASV